MSKGLGRFVQFGVARETVRGTSEAAPTFWIPVDELEVDEKDERVMNDQSRGLLESSVGENIVKQYSEISIKAPITDKTFPLFLYNFLGSLSTSGPTDSAYTHTWNVAQSVQHQALSLFVDDPLGAQDYKYALGMGKSLEINYERGKYLNFGASFRAKKGATATLTPATTTENRFLPHHLTFKIATTQAGLTGASATVIKSAKITFNPNLEDDDVLGAISPQDFNNKDFSVEGTLEALWENESAFKTASLLEATRALRFDLTNTDVLIGASSRPQVQFDFHAVNFRPVTRAIKLNDMVMQTIAFKAHYSLTDSKMVVATTRSAQVSY